MIKPFALINDEADQQQPDFKFPKLQLLNRQTFSPVRGLILVKSGAKMVSETKAGSSISVATTVAAAAAAADNFAAAAEDAFSLAAAEVFPAAAPDAFLPLLPGRGSGVLGSGRAMGDIGGEGARGGGGGCGEGDFCCCCIVEGGDVAAAGAVDDDDGDLDDRDIEEPPFFLAVLFAGFPLPFFGGRPLGVALGETAVLDEDFETMMASGGGEGVADLRTSSMKGAGEMERKAADSLIVVDSMEEEEEEEKIESLLPEKWRRDLPDDLVVEEPIFSDFECDAEGALVADRSASTGWGLENDGEITVWGRF